MRWQESDVTEQLNQHYSLDWGYTMPLYAGDQGTGEGWQKLAAGKQTSFMLQEAEDAAAAKLLQSCPTLCNPIDSRPPGSPAVTMNMGQEFLKNLPAK